MRWKNLARHGLLGTSLVGTAATSRANECGRPADDTVVTLTIGLDFAPTLGFVGGLEVRTCLADSAEALVRIEGGSAGVRLIGGARVRLFEKENEETWGDLVGAEGGIVVELFRRRGLGAHLALTFGDEARYAAVQGVLPIDGADRPGRASLLFGYAPFQQHRGGDAGDPVPGRPISCDGRVMIPQVVARRRSRGAEDRAVSAHFTHAAQLEYSSVWTFLRLAAELAAVGAPAELVARALDAADDEVRHAELCARVAGVALAPLAMAAAQPRFVRRSPHALAVLAAEAWAEGCINEGAAAEEARRAAEDARGEARALLATIARDEARHAELAWDVLAWLHGVAPMIVRAAVVEVPEIIAVRGRTEPALVQRGVASAEVRVSSTVDAVAEARRWSERFSA